MLLNQTFLEIEMIVGQGALGALRYALDGDTEITEILARDVENNVAVVKVGGILAAAAKRNRPSSFG
jgi:hypothetical protein